MAVARSAADIAAAIDPALIPPRDRRPAYAKRLSFRKTAARFVESAAQRGLAPDHRVLDLGCGVGRFAVGFAAFADAHGTSEGIDAAQQSIETCNTYIASRMPNFRFQVADVHNSAYRPDGDAPAASYRFPFADDTFDFVFSNSLFTHLLRRDAEHYLGEIGRVLRSGGRTLNTFFLLNAEAEHAMATSERPLKFAHGLGDGVARAQRIDQPEAAIAYQEEFIRRAHADAGLRVEGPLRYGYWSGREPSPGPGFGNKDIVVAVRE